MTAYEVAIPCSCRLCGEVTARDWIVDATPWVEFVRECLTCGGAETADIGRWKFSRKPDEVRT